jgi:Ca2+-binding RTX toxin-like protein
MDDMAGGRGNDTYVVDNIGDVVTEKAGSGIDTVRSSVDYSLGAFVERLVLTGTGDIDGTGNNLENRLIGNSADNVLDGGRGRDTLSGGEGNDTFRLLSDDAADMVLDFTSGLDKLALAGAEVGNGDTFLDGALELAGPGGFGTAAELVIFATDIVGDITVDSAAAAIGNAAEAYAVGDTRLFAVDNGQDTALYQFEAGNADAAVDAPELTLIGVLQGTAQTALADYQLM